MFELAIGVVLLAAPLYACVASSPPAGAQGVRGTVVISPARPGPQRAGDSGVGPYAGAAVRLVGAQDQVVAQGTTDAQGRFTLAAPPGHYEIEAGPTGAAYPRCDSAEVQVNGGTMIEVQVSCDSGLR